MQRVDYQKMVIQDLINLEKTGELELEPWYQRRSVWNPQQKSYLINTIFEQMPVPTIYIRHSLNEDQTKSIKEVVDGQQRIRSILEYYAGDIAARHPTHKKRLKFSELKKNEKSEFLMTALSVGYLVDADDADVIEVFGRINSVAKTLNGQEKRNALYSGEYKQFCLKFASNHIQFWRNYNIFTATQIARMEEIQFASDLTLNFINGLSDFSQNALNKVYQEYDEEFEERDEIKERLESVFGLIAELDVAVIADTIFSRPPLLFSLLFLMDELDITSLAKIRKNIFEIDRRFNNDKSISDRPKKEAEFFMAATSSTQRIKQRKVRHEYIKSFF